MNDDEQAPAEAPQDIIVAIESGYGARTRRPYVQVALGAAVTQMLPGDARHLAHLLIEAAEAADCDAMLFEFTQRVLGGDEHSAATLLAHYREYRAGARGEDPT